HPQYLNSFPTRRSSDLTYTKLDKLLEKSDFVLIMLPLTKQTYKYIGAKQFKKMKKSAFLINCSRGEVINEQELINALLTNEIARSEEHTSELQSRFDLV